MATDHVTTKIPRRFTPTHETAGLPGYPAIDVFGPHDKLVVLQDYGTVRRISGRSPCSGGVPGGACGWSIYVAARDGGDWYLTHFGMLCVRVGTPVTPGMLLGLPVDARDAPRGWSEHIHVGWRAPSA